MLPISFDRQQLHLYVITDHHLIAPRDVADAVTAAVEGGATLVQYREKGADRASVYATALRLRDVTRSRGVPFVVNDFVDCALAVQADGVHLGQGDLPLAAARAVGGRKLWYGVSTHSVAQARAIAREAPAYVAIGPVFPTRTKKDPDPAVGLAGVRAVRHAVGDLPVVAIGGIGPTEAARVRAAGADGISVISAAWAAGDVAAACRALAAPP